MSTMQYRLTLVTCAAAWLMLGLHLPVVHQLTHHGRPIQPTVLALLVSFALIGIAALWVLLRSAGPGRQSTSRGSSQS